MQQGNSRLKNLARLLKTAVEKHNESAFATSSVARYFERVDGCLSDEIFDSIFEVVMELAGASLIGKPDYERAARALILKAT
jgi:hypothetical protein